MHQTSLANIRPFLLLLAVALLGGCATNPVSGDKDLVLMSESQEIRTGKAANKEIIADQGRYPSEALQQYVNKIGQELAAKSHRSHLKYSFTVLDSTDVNAFALPGGYIFITRGLLAYLNSEEELAAVLGHEIGHVTARHSVRQQTASVASQALGVLLAVGTGSRQIGDLANVAGTALVRGYGREHELEADRLGAEYLARVGYDPEAMIDVIRVLKNQELFEKELARKEGRKARSGYSGLFSTHPDNDTRLKEVVRAAHQYKQPVLRKPSREQFLKKLATLSFGPDANDGVVHGNRFYHPGLGIALSFPKGWEIDNQEDKVLATAPSGDGLVQLTLDDRDGKLTPKRYLSEKLNLRQVRHGESIRHNGEPGFTGITPLETPWGKRDGRVSVLYLKDRTYIIAGAAKNKTYQYDHEMLATAHSLHAITKAERGQARVKRIQLVRAAKGDSYASLARKTPALKQAEQQLRLLNGDYPSGEPKPGDLIKVVR